MKSILASVLIFLAAAFMYAGCQSKLPKSAVASDTEFTVAVGANAYLVENEEIELPDTATITALRGPGDVAVAVNYLTALSDGAASVINVTDAIKGQKLTTFQVWVSLVPVLVSEIKTLVQTGKTLKNFNAFYNASQGLTTDEKAAVAKAFQAKFKIPYKDAEELAELVVEASIVNIQIAQKIKQTVKK